MITLPTAIGTPANFSQGCGFTQIGASNRQWTIPPTPLSNSVDAANILFEDHIVSIRTRAIFGTADPTKEYFRGGIGILIDLSGFPAMTNVELRLLGTATMSLSIQPSATPQIQDLRQLSAGRIELYPAIQNVRQVAAATADGITYLATRQANSDPPMYLPISDHSFTREYIPLVTGGTATQGPITWHASTQIDRTFRLVRPETNQRLVAGFALDANSDILNGDHEHNHVNQADCQAYLHAELVQRNNSSTTTAEPGEQFAFQYW